MKNLFLGLLFLTIDVRAGLGSMTVNLLPDFAGYIFLNKGFEEMKDTSSRFAAAKPWTVALAVYSGVLFGADLLGITLGSDLVMWALRLGATAAGFYVSHLLVLGIADLEQANAMTLGSEKLKTMWLYWVVFAGIGQLIRWIPLVGNVAIIAAAILGIAFMVTFYKTKTAWEQKKT